MDIASEMEQATLREWVEQTGVLDLGVLYDQLRESLTEAHQAWQVARMIRDHDAADKAMGEVIGLTALLAVIVDGLRWRRGVYLASGRPLGVLLWPGSAWNS